MKTNKFTRLALLVSLALILFIVENALPAPVPVPGIKLGLANVVTVWAIYFCTLREAALVLCSRIFLGALLTGNFMALTFSLAGGALSFLGGACLKRFISPARLWLTSAICGVLHNVGQIAAAILITRAVGLVSYLPFLMVSGVVGGALTGQIAAQTQKRLKKAFSDGGKG